MGRYGRTIPDIQLRLLGCHQGEQDNRNKIYEIKNLALFTRVAKDLTKTDLVGNSTSYTENGAITTIELRNPDTDAGFYALRHTDPTSGSNETFKLSVRTSAGNVTIPEKAGSLQLNGNYAKILVTDFKFGDELLIYSTAEILTYGIFDKKPTLVLWVFNGEDGEFLMANARQGKVTSCNKSEVVFTKSKHALVVNFKKQHGRTAIELDNGIRVLILDRDAAHRFWVPGLTNDPRVPVDQTGAFLIIGRYSVGNELT